MRSSGGRIALLSSRRMPWMLTSGGLGLRTARRGGSAKLRGWGGCSIDLGSLTGPVGTPASTPAVSGGLLPHLSDSSRERPQTSRAGTRTRGLCRKLPGDRRARFSASGTTGSVVPGHQKKVSYVARDFHRQSWQLLLASSSILILKDSVLFKKYE